jgi:hypothetical protein
MNRRTKTFLTLVGAVVLLGAEAAVFWMQDWRYNLPTPPPALLEQPALGSTPVLPAAVRSTAAPGLPILLHFYNPDCPCSRFNRDHVRQLARQYQGRAQIIAVLQMAAVDATALEREARHLGFPAIADSEGRIAATCGVYATPQAVILDPAGKLLFRGNYNRSRYCTAPVTEFARLALEAAVSGKATPDFPEAAVVAYGCSLPDSLEN